MSDPYEADFVDPNDDVEDPVDDELEDQDTEQPEEDEELDPLAEDEEPEEPPARQPSRGDNRIARLAREAKEAKERTALLERQLADIAARNAQPAQPSPAEVQAHLATLEPWERTEYLRQQDSAQTQAVLRQMQFQQQEQMDKIAYEALKTRAPIAAKLESEVEKRLSEMRAGGTTAPRETVLRWVIGDRALANARRATGRAQKTAAANRDRQQARPPSGRADAAPSDRRGGNTSSARDKRLSEIII